MSRLGRALASGALAGCMLACSRGGAPVATTVMSEDASRAAEAARRASIVEQALVVLDGPDADAAARAAAIQTLGHMDEAGRLALLERMPRAEPTLRRAMAFALLPDRRTMASRSGLDAEGQARRALCPILMPEIVAALRDPDPASRREALRAIPECAGSADVDVVLEPLASDPDVTVRAAAIEAVSHIGWKGEDVVGAALVRALEDGPNAPLAAHALAAFRCCSASAVPLLVARFRYPDASVSTSAGADLERIGGPAIAPLAAALRDLSATPDLRSRAAAHLGRAWSPVTEEQGLVHDALVAGLADPEPGVQVMAARSLARRDDWSGALPTLVESLAHPWRDVRMGAAAALFCEAGLDLPGQQDGIDCHFLPSADERNERDQATSALCALQEDALAAVPPLARLTSIPDRAIAEWATTTLEELAGDCDARGGGEAPTVREAARATLDGLRSARTEAPAAPR